LSGTYAEGHYNLTVTVPPNLRLSAAFDELCHAIRLAQ